MVQRDGEARALLALEHICRRYLAGISLLHDDLQARLD